MLVSGVFGYIFEKAGYSTAPMLLAFVLAPILEDNLRKAFVISGGSTSGVFFSSTITIVLTVVFIIIASVPIVRAIISKINRK